MDRKKLKAAARAQLKGQFGKLLLLTLIAVGIPSIAVILLSKIPLANLFVTFVITPAFSLSLTRIYIYVADGGRPEVADAFSGFDDFWSAFKVEFLTRLFVYLWSLLLWIPGIVKSVSYYFAPYILAENPGKPALECISESKEMTDGYKMELFMLSLSFMGWLLLGIVTLGIAFIWVIPYMHATSANAYRWFNSPTEETK